MNLKEVVGKKAVDYVKDGMIVGLGTGSTVFYFVHALADRVKEGLNVEMVSTSIQTVELAKSLGLSIKELTHDELKAAVKGMPKSELEKKEYNIVDFLVESNLVQSKRQAREDVNNGAVYVNGDKVTDLEYIVEGKDRLEDGFTVLRRGKKKYLLVEYK